MSAKIQLERIESGGIVAILRGGFSVDDVLRIAETLIHNDVTALEITLNSPAALGALPQLQTRFGEDALIGAGTIRNLTDWQNAFDAGAAFTVAPNFSPVVAERAQKADQLYMPGVATPTEAVTAFEAGCVAQKLFPAGALGGAKYLKAVRAPLNDIRFVPVGGVTTGNLGDYLDAGAVAVGMGSSLIPAKDWTLERIADLCRDAKQIIQQKQGS